MKRLSVLLLFLLPALLPLAAQNWDINTVHRVNSWDGRFIRNYNKVISRIRNYNKVISRSEPYLAVGVPVAMALAGWIKDDRALLKDALYVGTSVAGAFVVTYGLKYIVGRDRPYERYPDRVHPYSREDSPSFPSGHTATAFALATSLSIRYPKWYVIAPSALWACSVGIYVLAGAALGAGFAVANIYINKWLNRWLFGE